MWGECEAMNPLAFPVRFLSLIIVQPADGNAQRSGKPFDCIAARLFLPFFDAVDRSGTHVRQLTQASHRKPSLISCQLQPYPN